MPISSRNKRRPNAKKQKKKGQNQSRGNAEQPPAQQTPPTDLLSSALTRTGSTQQQPSTRTDSRDQEDLPELLQQYRLQQHRLQQHQRQGQPRSRGQEPEPQLYRIGPEPPPRAAGQPQRQHQRQQQQQQFSLSHEQRLQLQRQLAPPANASPVALFQYAVVKRDWEAVKRLSGPAVDGVPKQAIDEALGLLCAKGQIEIVPFLVRVRKANVNVSMTHQGHPSSPLYAAVTEQRLAIVQYLVTIPHLEINAQPNGQTALHYAVGAEQKEMVKTLLKHPNINANELSVNTGVAALHMIVMKTHLWGIFGALLLNHPSTDINIKCGPQKAPIFAYDTPLYVACYFGNIFGFRMLLFWRGINPYAIRPYDRWTFHRDVTKQDRIDMMDLLERSRMEYDVDNLQHVMKEMIPNPTPIVAIAESLEWIHGQFAIHKKIKLKMDDKKENSIAAPIAKSNNKKGNAENSSSSAMSKEEVNCVGHSLLNGLANYGQRYLPQHSAVKSHSTLSKLDWDEVVLESLDQLRQKYGVRAALLEATKPAFTLVVSWLQDNDLQARIMAQYEREWNRVHKKN